MQQLYHKPPGQSLVEFTLLLPLLLFMVVGMADFGLAFNTHVMIRNAVAEGSYYAAQNPGDEDGVRTQILHELRDLNPALTSGDITISACVDASTGWETVIEVDYDHTLLFGFLGPDQQITLHNETTIPQFGGCS